MTDKVFFDTNILVYFADEKDPVRQSVAKKLIVRAVQTGNGMISTQCLQELYNVLTKKLICPPLKAAEIVRMFGEIFPPVKIELNHILKAASISTKYTLSFWDSLIISTASASGCIIIYSEDMNSGQITEGTKIVNPFKSENKI